MVRTFGLKQFGIPENYSTALPCTSTLITCSLNEFQHISMPDIETAITPLTPAITTLFSVSFLILTFLLGQYEQTKYEEETEWKPYYHGFWIMNASMAFSAISLITAIAHVLSNSFTYQLAVTSLITLGLAIVAILVGIAFLDYKILTT